MRILLVVNATASSVTARRQVVVRMVLAGRHQVEVAETTHRGHATELAVDAARRGVDVVAALGGDGTLNEVANGVVGTPCALAPLPGGSTNVFARSIGLPDDPVDAAVVTLDALDAGHVARVGVGAVNGRRFLFHVGIGWDAALVEVVERRARMKRYAGHPLFIYAGLRTFFGGYDRTRPHFRVRFADGRQVPDGYFAVVLNSNPYTFVGNRPFNVAPDATLDRALTAVTIRSMKVRPFLGLMSSALGDGRRLRTRPELVDYAPDLHELVFERLERPAGTGPAMPYQVDGDHLGEADRLRIAYEPDSLRLVLPTAHA